MDDGRAEVPRGAGRGGDSRAETAKLPTQAPTSLEGKSPFYDLSCANIEVPLGISVGAITGGTMFFMGCSEAFEFAHVLLQQNPESWLLRTADALRAGPGQQRHCGDRCVSTRGPRARLPAPWEAASEGAKGHAGEREGWRADVDARRWDRKPRSGPGTRPGRRQAAPRTPRPIGWARGAPLDWKRKQRGDLHQKPCPHPQGRAGEAAGTRSASDRGARPDGSRAEPGRQAACTRQPEATYSSGGSPLLAALARGVQTDVFALTSFLTGVFTLGETGREERRM